jgi:molybdopterin molybdotransferase
MTVSVFDALDLIKKHINKVGIETIKIEEASQRVSAENIFATYPLPRFNNSAMDGYAILYKNSGKDVKVIGKILAGEDKNILLEDKTAIKIMTGARVPKNTTAVVPQEDIEILDNDNIRLPNELKNLQHIKFIGEDVAINDTIINKNSEINFATISLLASQGITEIKVYKKPKVAVFASGEELRPHFETIKPYQIYNSNSPSLIARSKELGCDVDFMGSAKDSLNSLKEHIEKSLDYDLIITSGGVSVGEADFTKESFASFNMESIFSGIVIKPGKPTVFGKINNAFVLNLPGNPLASQIIFEMFGTILIQNLKGNKDIYHKPIEAKIKTKLSNKKGRITLIPGIFDGEYFTPSTKRGPGMVSVLNQCDSFMVVDENVETIEKNSTIKILEINNKRFLDDQKDFLTYE